MSKAEFSLLVDGALASEDRSAVECVADWLEEQGHRLAAEFRGRVPQFAKVNDREWLAKQLREYVDRYGLPAEIDDDDWECALSFACGEERGYCCSSGTPTAVPPGSAGVAATPFDRADVARVIAVAEGCRDDEEWLGVFELKDGRLAMVAAGCDYTGWD